MEIWIDSEPNAYNETWYKLSLGQVFCASGTNASNRRFKVDYSVINMIGGMLGGGFQ
ncbi:hypothetical protein [Micromonospora sp. NPDC093277]|uniref:hypothetical protein n=1 Tax=Micromonospora sp. NPDC093277 TaxID=3364291 RepID=UPI003816908A